MRKDGLYIESYKALEKLYEEGKIKAIEFATLKASFGKVNEGNGSSSSS